MTCEFLAEARAEFWEAAERYESNEAGLPQAAGLDHSSSAVPALGRGCLFMRGNMLFDFPELPIKDHEAEQEQNDSERSRDAGWRKHKTGCPLKYKGAQDRPK
jgi:hypothetical protein